MNKKIKIATRAGLAAGMLCLGGTCMPLHGENAAPVAAQSHINSPAAPGYLSRGAAMTNDGNPRGTIDQLKEALRQFPTANQAEKARLEKALAAMALPGVDAMPMVEAFLSDYPASAWRERALMAVADIYYDRGDYAQALKAYRALGENSLDGAEADAAAYREAYCLLKLADYNKASAIYSRLENSRGYAADAKFYQGYIAYVKGDYSTAARLMRNLPRNGMPTVMADYYLAQIDFMHADYKSAAGEAKALLASRDTDPAFKAEAQRIAGESLFQTGNTSEALPYLREYVASTDSPQPSALYILGVDDYNAGRYQQAIERLTPVTPLDNAMGQSAYLYIGQSYIKLDNFTAASMALDKACRMNHDPAVQEMALYNLAVARSSGGKVPFGSSVGLFEEFLTRYPDSRMAPEVADYVVSGYMTDNNYPAALAAINKIKHPSKAVLAAKQKVLYTLGTRRLQAGSPREALAYLHEAATMTGCDASIAAEATLWEGECDYALGDYKGAVKAYNSYLRNPSASKSNQAVAWYDLGYARFALKDFPDAIADFNKYLAATSGATDPRMLADARNRIADSRYYTSDFAGAAADYRKAAELHPASADYPTYQLGLMQGLQRDHEGKIATLSDMIASYPSSALVPSALLEMGESYGELGRTDRAIETYTTLAGRYPATAQGRQGELLLAITYLNSGNRSRAIEHYKKVIENYPSSDEARVASDDLKQLYADAGQVGAYVAFINSVENAPKPETAELAALSLTAAEKAAESGRDADAVALASELIEKYPDSHQAVEALAIKAEAAYRLGNSPEALEAYTALEQRASDANAVNAARMGIMRVSRDLGDNEKALATADILLESSAMGASGKKEVAFTKALALADLSRGDEAVAIWEELAGDIDDLYGTKSAFNLASYYADKKQDAKALDAVNKLIDANPPHDYWLARGFILLSDLLRRKGDTFEADEYLRSLRDNYPGTEPDIFRMIDERLNH